MLFRMSAPPVARVADARPSWRNALARLAEPPSWASTMFTWSLSGAFAAAAGNMFAAFARMGILGEIRLLGSLGIGAASMISALGLLVPFLACGGAYLVLFTRRRAPLTGAIFGAAFHSLAHLAVVAWFLSQSWHANLEVPLLIGGLWGAWLPSVVGREERTHGARF